MNIEGVKGAIDASRVSDQVLGRPQFPVNRDFADSSIRCGNQESWGSCAHRWVTFIPNLIWTAVKRVIYVVTCCQYCADEPTNAQLIDALEKLKTIWAKDAPAAEKDQAWKDFMKLGTRAKEVLADTYVEARAANEVLKQDQVAQWKEKYGAGVHEEAMRRLDTHDADLLASTINHLRGVEKKADGAPDADTRKAADES